MTEQKPESRRNLDVPSLLDPPRARKWHHYALARLPGSLLITLIFVLFVFPLMLVGAMLLARWLAG